jgi:hypothetical protein
MDDIPGVSQTNKSTESNAGQIGQWEEVAEEENFFIVNKAAEEKSTEERSDDVLGKRSHLLFQSEQEADIADIKQMKKRIEQDRVEVYKKEVYQDVEEALAKLPATSGFKKR